MEPSPEVSPVSAVLREIAENTNYKQVLDLFKEYAAKPPEKKDAKS